MSRSAEKFCGNPTCVLHVAPGDTNVQGQGDWATLQNGLTFARVRIGDLSYCHRCADIVQKGRESGGIGQ